MPFFLAMAVGDGFAGEADFSSGNWIDDLSIAMTAMRALVRHLAAFATRENRNRRPRMR